ncbi:MAG: hypothetical protein K8I82_00795 [Anaerolineae bacterium]|nr:hypothetical protein [Anaerolineae bacterium]
MIAFDASNSHFDYLEVVRHWNANSEKYTGGDALLTFLIDGWNLQGAIFYEEFWHAGVRMVTVYYFQLEREGEKLLMPVFNNPYVDRLVHSMPFPVLPLAERERFNQRKAAVNRTN